MFVPPCLGEFVTLDEFPQANVPDELEIRTRDLFLKAMLERFSNSPFIVLSYEIGNDITFELDAAFAEYGVEDGLGVAIIRQGVKIGKLWCSKIHALEIGLAVPALTSDAKYFVSLEDTFEIPLGRDPKRDVVVRTEPISLNYKYDAAYIVFGPSYEALKDAFNNFFVSHAERYQ
jgi:hypothetical protein